MAIRVPSFSYPISRPYPYKWFTWVVIAGFICFTIFFSFLNVAANGYVLSVQYTINPNQTMAQKRWTQHFPFNLLGKAVTTCQSQDLPVNTQFFTNKLSLPYTLTSVWQQQDDATVTLPSLKYTNNALENCAVAFIEIDLESADRTAAQQGFKAWGPKAFASITCSINNDEVPTGLKNVLGPTYFNLTVGYEFVTPTIETGSNFRFLQAPDNKTQASLWWGESLLSWYWLNLSSAMSQHYLFEQVSVTKGSIAFHRSNVTDMTNLDFWEGLGFHFVSIAYDSNGDVKGTPECCINPAGHNFTGTAGALAANNVEPNIWIEADSFAKTFYATILADLGQNSSDNILANEATLTLFTKNITDMSGANGVETLWLKAGPARKPYTEVKDVTGPLQITPSVIYSQYFCQVPELKSAGSLFVAILIADLVFLQALWKVLTWSTIAWLQHSDPHAKFCEGCLRSAAADRGLELSPTDLGTTTQYLPVPSARPRILGRKAGHASSESQQRLVSEAPET